VVIPRTLIPRAMELQGNEGARQLLEDAGVRRIEAGHLGEAADVDTPADLEALRRSPR
jgi:CTP:molybdopterin cytidylyltransferase MocA